MTKQISSFIFLLFLGGWSRVIVTASDVTCESGDDRIPDPYYCNKFYACDNGIPVSMNCPPGLLYNAELGMCDWPANVNCTALTPIPSSTMTTVPWNETTSSVPATTESSPVHCKEEKETKIICYFNNWAWYRSGEGKFLPENIDPSLCTHVVYAFAILGEDWKIKEFDQWADIDNQFYYRTTIGLKAKNPCTKTLIGLGGWNESAKKKYSIMMNDSDKRRIFVASVIEFCQKHHFDGIDLDIEYPASPTGLVGDPRDKQGFTHLVKEMRAAMPPQLILTAAVSPNPKICERGYDVRAIAESVDWLGVMTYDYSGAWDGKTGHIAPLYADEDEYSCDVSIKWWLDAGCPASKLIMGLPSYGQSFTLDDPTQCSLNGLKATAGTAGQYTQQPGILSYYEIQNRLQSPDTIFVPGTDRSGPYLCYGGNQIVSYDDTEMIEKKFNYAKNIGLGGFMIWDVTMESFQEHWNPANRKFELLTTLNNLAYPPDSTN